MGQTVYLDVSMPLGNRKLKITIYSSILILEFLRLSSSRRDGELSCFFLFIYKFYFVIFDVSQSSEDTSRRMFSREPFWNSEYGVEIELFESHSTAIVEILCLFRYFVVEMLSLSCCYNTLDTWQMQFSKHQIT